MTSTELKFTIGGDLYVSVSTWLGKPKIHFRKHVISHSKFDNKKLLVLPTRFGVTLNKKQMDQLLLNLPLIVAELNSLLIVINDGNSNTVDIPPMLDPVLQTRDGLCDTADSPLDYSSTSRIDTFNSSSRPVFQPSFH